MLLVMHTTNILIKPGHSSEFPQPPFQISQRVSLWDLSWEKIDTFMPNLQNDLFPGVEPSTIMENLPFEQTRDEMSPAIPQEHVANST